jgi:hypothetical protein
MVQDENRHSQAHQTSRLADLQDELSKVHHTQKIAVEYLEVKGEMILRNQVEIDRVDR